MYENMKEKVSERVLQSKPTQVTSCLIGQKMVAQWVCHRTGCHNIEGKIQRKGLKKSCTVKTHSHGQLLDWARGGRTTGWSLDRVSSPKRKNLGLRPNGCSEGLVMDQLVVMRVLTATPITKLSGPLAGTGEDGSVCHADWTVFLISE